MNEGTFLARKHALGKLVIICQKLYIKDIAHCQIINGPICLSSLGALLMDQRENTFTVRFSPFLKAAFSVLSSELRVNYFGLGYCKLNLLNTTSK